MEARVNALESAMEARVSDLAAALEKVAQTVSRHDDAIGDLAASLKGLLRGQQTLAEKLDRLLPKQKSPLEEESLIDSSETRNVLKGESSGGGMGSVRTRSELQEVARRVELPVFTGEDPFAWIARAETYFAIQEITGEARVAMAQVCMGGMTQYWYLSLRDSQKDLTWEVFKQSLLDRYGTEEDSDPRIQLKHLQQTGRVDEYIEEFERLALRIPNIADSWYVSQFVGGLRPELMGRVLALEPSDKHKLLNVARKVERALLLEGVIRYPKPKNNASSWTTRGITMAPKLVQPVPVQGRGYKEEEKARGNAKGIPKELYEERRSKGLCFSCGQKFVPGHHKICPERGVRMAVWEYVELPEEEGDVVVPEENDQNTEEWEMICRALEGTGEIGEGEGYPPSMVMNGVVQGVPITVLVDSGATHNYASKNLCRTLDFKVTPTKPYGIRMGDDRRIVSQGMCKGVTLGFGSWEMQIDAYILETTGPDLILGIKWLQQLSPMTVDWRSMQMTFQWHGKEITLIGDTEGKRQPQSLWQIVGKRVVRV